MGESSIPVKVGDTDMEDDCPSITDHKVQCVKYSGQRALQFSDSHKTE